jgi:hypothetical protein
VDLMVIASRLPIVTETTEPYGLAYRIASINS